MIRMDAQAIRIRERAAALRAATGRRREEISEEVVFAEIPDGSDRVIRFSWAPTRGSRKLELRIRGWIREFDGSWTPMAKVGLHVYLPHVSAFAEAVATAMEHLEPDGNGGVRLSDAAVSSLVSRRANSGTGSIEAGV